MRITDSIDNASDHFNYNHASREEKTKVLSLSDVDDIVKFYRSIGNELRAKQSGKFLHAIGTDEAIELIDNNEQAMVGYYLDGKLVGSIYTRPFEVNDPYFHTPTYDRDGVSYDFGGFAVTPACRGRGVISKLARIVYSGVKDFAEKKPEENISGMGIEISTENFSCLSATSKIADYDGKPIVNFVGYHYIDDENLIDNDATILGYNSFNRDAKHFHSYHNVPKIVMNGVQKDCFENLVNATEQIGSFSNGSTTFDVDEHRIVTLNTYFDGSFRSMLDIQRDQDPNQ